MKFDQFQSSQLMLIANAHSDSKYLWFDVIWTLPSRPKRLRAESSPELFEATVQIVAHHAHALARPFGDLFCRKAFVVDKLNGPALSGLECTQHLLDEDAHFGQRIP